MQGWPSVAKNKRRKNPKRVAAGKKAYRTRKQRDPEGVALFHAIGGANSGGQFDKDQLLAKYAGSIGGTISRRTTTKPSPCGTTIEMDGIEMPMLVDADPEEATDD